MGSKESPGGDIEPIRDIGADDVSLLYRPGRGLADDGSRASPTIGLGLVDAVGYSVIPGKWEQDQGGGDEAEGDGQASNIAPGRRVRSRPAQAISSIFVSSAVVRGSLFGAGLGGGCDWAPAGVGVGVGALTVRTLQKWLSSKLSLRAA